MQFIEFDYITEDGHEVVVEGSGKVVHESNYAADHDNRKGYPLRTVTNIKFKCLLDDGSVLSKKELSEDDLTNIEDIIANTLTENTVDTEDGYDYFNGEEY